MACAMACVTCHPMLIIVPDMENGLLVVTARPADQKKIETIIEQLNDPQAALRETKVYRLQYADPATARLTLSQFLPRSLFTVDMPTNSLVANSLPEDHERIQRLSSSWTSHQTDGRETVVYRLQEGDVTALYATLQSLLPKAVLGIDRSSRTLVATAHEGRPIAHPQGRRADGRSDVQRDWRRRSIDEMGELYSLRYALRILVARCDDRDRRRKRSAGRHGQPRRSEEDRGGRRHN